MRDERLWSLCLYRVYRLMDGRRLEGTSTASMNSFASHIHSRNQIHESTPTLYQVSLSATFGRPFPLARNTSEFWARRRKGCGAVPALLSYTLINGMHCG